ncbi:MAG: hypothetical protein VKO39_09990 [Cyanobacteriota bacterium]|nr:hypothetical protein [Cyanobacteriota bacterium]
MAAKHRTASREKLETLSRWSSPQPQLERQRLWAEHSGKLHRHPQNHQDHPQNHRQERSHTDWATQPRA